MADKVITKTMGIAILARSIVAPLPVAVGVWDLYVKRAVLDGAAVCTPPPAAVCLLSIAQRQASSFLLGFRRLAPGPAVLPELGRMQLSTASPRARLAS